MRSIFSPYRICPIGAHVDHQGGVTLGRTIHLGTTLTYEPLETHEIHITSDQFGETKFSVGDLDTAHWARYAQAAARVLNAKCGMHVCEWFTDWVWLELFSFGGVGVSQSARRCERHRTHQ